jgi:hypothetical protein
MKHISTSVLKTVVILSAMVVLSLCIGVSWLLVTEWGSATKYATLALILFTGTYSAGIPYFIGTANALKFLHYIDTDQLNTQLAHTALLNLKLCASAVFVICTVGGIPFFISLSEFDDAPGAVLIGIFVATVTFFAAKYVWTINKRLGLTK